MIVIVRWSAPGQRWGDRASWLYFNCMRVLRSGPARYKCGKCRLGRIRALIGTHCAKCGAQVSSIALAS